MSAIMGVLFAIVLSTMMLPSWMKYEEKSVNNTTNAAMAEQIKVLSDAVQQYVQANATAIEAVATPTTPATITVPMLQATQFLPTSFSAINPYNQAWQAQVLQPTAGKLEAIILSQGGAAISADNMGAIVGLAGQQGGLVPIPNQYGPSGTCAVAGNPCMMGSYGGWEASLSGFTNPGSGHVGALMYFNNGALANNYLYRNAVPGNPQLNTMNTPLVMASPATIGTSCTTKGSIAQSQDANGSGSIVTCNGTVWTSSPCISTGADLNTIEDGARCYNGVGNPNSPAGGDWFFLEVYRHINVGNDYTVQRVMGMTGASAGKVWHRNQQSGSPGAGFSSWVQQADNLVSIWDQPTEGGVVTIKGVDGSMMHLETLPGGTFRLVNSPWTAQLMSVDQSGNMTLNQSAATNVGWLNPGWAVETWGCTNNGSIAKSAYTIIDGWSWTGNHTLTCQNNVWTTAVQAQSVTLGTDNGGAVQGSGCGPNGKIAQDGGGNILSCQGGVWASTGGHYGGDFKYALSTVGGGFYCVGPGDCVPNPLTGGYGCPSGYTAYGGITGQSYRFSPWDQTMFGYSCIK